MGSVQVGAFLFAHNAEVLLKLFADFRANGVFTAIAGACQLILGQFVDDFDARQSERQ